MEGKQPTGRPRSRWRDQIRKDIEMRGENWEEKQENRKWENRDGWRFHCNIRAIHLERLKNDDGDDDGDDDDDETY